MKFMRREAVRDRTSKLFHGKGRSGNKKINWYKKLILMKGSNKNG
jgi:hypothetical protein